MYILRSDFPGLGWEIRNKGTLLLGGVPTHSISTNLVDIQFPTRADAEAFVQLVAELGAKCWPSPLEKIPAQ